MEGLGSRLALEVSRREIFERKNAELERINDELRVENAVSVKESYYTTALIVEMLD